MYSQLPYDPRRLPRELNPHYISASASDIEKMLQELGANSFDDLYKHIPQSLRLKDFSFPDELSYEKLADHMLSLAAKNKVKLSFLGDGLPHYTTPEVVPHILGLRNLTTAYTPYQPERSQGTLISLWIYQSAIAALTGFEAINASFYDRSTAIFEAIRCAQRLSGGAADTALIFSSLYPGDVETVKTLANFTETKLVFIPLDSATGKTSLQEVQKAFEQNQGKVTSLVFPQLNQLGLLEDVDAITNYAEKIGVKSIAVIDPMTIAKGALKPPSSFGEKGASMFVAEGQHISIPPNFGGPGLGIFGIRFNAENKNDVRQTSGRFVGKTKDLAGRDCLAMVLSTREQHIRREKATSNICSNQSYLATLTGAALLERGDAGLTAIAKKSREMAKLAVEKLTEIAGVQLAFPKAAFWNEICLEVPAPAGEVLKRASAAGIHLGVNVSNRVNGSRNLLLLSFTDRHTNASIDTLVKFFRAEFKGSKASQSVPEISADQIRQVAAGIPQVPAKEVVAYYTALGEQNVSPDDNIYALGSCTMKYNPYINDWAAALEGFAQMHPEAPEEDSQGALEIFYRTQEYFKAITGLAGVTTQPVAGAQGELVGIKLFQAYHHSRGEGHRNILLIPRSAHGTNPATATMAGYKSDDIRLIEADSTGQMDLAQVKSYIQEYGRNIVGIMVTNPNTSGVFEVNFKEVADLVHSVGGLVYMDGANMNAIAGWLDLGKMGVDAVHNNTHKTWSIPHGGGGPGDAYVAVSNKLLDFLPGVQVVEANGQFKTVRAKHTIGSFHRHLGNFGHKVRCYTYLRALGKVGIPKMAAVAVLSARYLHKNLSPLFPTLPVGAESTPRMHEFIVTLSKESFKRVEDVGIPKANIIARIGKLFLDFGIHAPTVAFPEVYGLMIEPTESYSKKELDDFTSTVKMIQKILQETPEVLQTVPHFTPIDRVDEIGANKNLVLSEQIPVGLFPLHKNRVNPLELARMKKEKLWEEIRKAHAARSQKV